MIVERTHYFAKPGRAADVLATRRRACAVRLALGLSAGAIALKADPTADGPDVAWNCRFADKSEHDADLAARAASPDFAEVRRVMTGLIERFERLVETPAAGPGGLIDTDLADHPLCPSEHAFTSGGYALKAYLYLPPGDGPWPLVVYNHGSGVDQGAVDVVQPGVAATLNGWGLACLMPHRRGYGNSSGPSWRSECPDEPFSDAYNQQILARLDRESDDVVAAYHMARALPGIDGGRVAVMGSSFGGVNTLFAAAKEPGFRCAVEFAGAAMNWDRNPTLAAAMIEAARRVTCPIFFIQAENDFSIRPTRELAAALADRGPRMRGHVYPPFGLTNWEGHLLAGRGPMIWGPDVRDFLETWMGA
jgi:dienelactone hydrolase